MAASPTDAAPTTPARHQRTRDKTLAGSDI
jgi:hypothetical protein